MPLVDGALPSAFLYVMSSTIFGMLIAFSRIVRLSARSDGELIDGELIVGETGVVADVAGEPSCVARPRPRWCAAMSVGIECESPSSGFLKSSSVAVALATSVDGGVGGTRSDSAAASSAGRSPYGSRSLCAPLGSIGVEFLRSWPACSCSGFATLGASVLHSARIFAHFWRDARQRDAIESVAIAGKPRSGEFERQRTVVHLRQRWSALVDAHTNKRATRENQHKRPKETPRSAGAPKC